MDEIETTQSADVSPEQSSAAPVETVQESSAPEKSSETKTSSEKSVPYERFQEIIQQKNEFLKRFEESDRRYQELQSKFAEFSKPKPEVPKENPLLARLKSVDPEFGKWAEEQEARASKLAELEQWKATAEQNRLRDEVVNTVEKLHMEHKVSNEDKEIYNSLLRQTATSIEATGRMLSPKDLPGLYKQVHELISKRDEARERARLASYTTTKKADSSTPTSKKGSEPKKQAKQEQLSRDPEERRAQIVKRALEQHRADKL